MSAGEAERLARAFDLSVDDLLHAEERQIAYRVNLALPETQQAIAWFERCIDNSLFVRNLGEMYGQAATRR